MPEGPREPANASLSRLVPAEQSRIWNSGCSKRGTGAGASLRAMRWILVIDELRLRVPLTSGYLRLGSSPDADIVLDHPTVSRRHAALRVGDDGVTVEDRGSSNGTRVDGRRVTEQSPLPAATTLHLGSLVCRLETATDEDLEPALEFETEPDPHDESVARATLNVGSTRAYVEQSLPAIVERLESVLPGHELEPAQALPAVQTAGSVLFESLPCRGLQILEKRDRGVLFQAGEITDEPDASVEAGELRLEARLVPGAHARGVSALLLLGLRLAALAWSPTTESSEEPEAETEGPSLPEPATVDVVLQRIYSDARRVARGDVGVLIEGESGTGKELLARFVHAASKRSEQPMLTLNCAALPRDLLEAELFGIERGVATGVEARAGKFEAAHGGTLFLDEIGDMALETQAKILRVLQEGEVYRLGASASRPARVRVLAATHRDLEAMIAQEDFRLDLYHRIADARFRLPPLRERLVDLPNLAAHFLLHAAEEQGVKARGISRAALDALLGHSWPGNVRQLEREMTRAALFLEDGELLQTRHLQVDLTGRAPGGSRHLKARLESTERGLIGEALARHDGNVRAAAEELGVGRTTLYRRMRDLGIEP